MKNLPSLTTETYLNDNSIAQYYHWWAKKNLNCQIANSFLHYHLMGSYKSIRDMEFRDFDFNKTIIFEDIIKELNVKQFVNDLLDKSSVTMPERRYRFRSYCKRLNVIIGKNKLVAARNYLREKYGFGIYQLNSVKVTRIDNKDKVYSSAAIVLIPTHPKCLDYLKKYYGKEVIGELKRRNSLFLKDWQDRELTATHEKEMQEEIQKGLIEWELEE